MFRFLNNQKLLYLILIVTLNNAKGQTNCNNLDNKLNVAVEKMEQLQRSVDFFRQTSAADWKIMHQKFLEMESHINEMRTSPRAATNSLHSTAATHECLQKSYCRSAGVTEILAKGGEKSLNVLCAADRWIVVMQRLDGSLNFHNKNWAAYKDGFGKVSATDEFFVGLQPLHTLTLEKSFELLIELENYNWAQRVAHYSEFSVGDEASAFRLGELGNYVGDAGESFKYHEGQGFSTLDRDNDAKAHGSCSEEFNSAGWFKACMEANLFGLYIKGKNDYFKEALHWGTFGGPDQSLKGVKMSIREKC